SAPLSFPTRRSSDLPGTVTFGGTNTFTTLAVDSGTVNVGNGTTSGSLGSGSVTLANNAVLNFTTSSNYNFGQAISGVGTINQIRSEEHTSELQSPYD